MHRQLDEKTLVSGQIAPEEIAALRRHGVTMIVNNRPDGEEPEQPLAKDIQAAAEAAGMEYRFIPIQRGIGPSDVEAMQEAYRAVDDGKMLAFCRSGQRSTLAWAVARSEDGVAQDELERCAASVGVDLAPVAHLL